MGKTVLLNGSLAESLINFRGALIKDMIRRGHDVHVTAPTIDPEIAAAVAALGADLHEVPLSRTGFGLAREFRYYAAMRRLIRAINPDLVINYTIKPNIWGSLAAGRAGVPSVSMVTGLGYAFIEGRGIKRRVSQRVARILYRLATQRNRTVVFQNPDDRDDFVRAGCLADPSKSRLVNGSGVDTAYFAAVPLPAEAVFLMIARLLWSKGLAEYAEAARLLLDRVPDVRIQLAGFLDEGPDAASQSDLDGWCAKGIEYLGHLKDVRPALAGASVFVLPSYREGTPRTVLEAMAMGRPIVTTDVPGCRETTRDRENGLLVPRGDAKALAEAMAVLAMDPSLRTKMGLRSRQLAEERYAVDRVNATLLEHLEL